MMGCCWNMDIQLGFQVSPPFWEIPTLPHCTRHRDNWTTQVRMSPDFSFNWGWNGVEHDEDIIYITTIVVEFRKLGRDEITYLGPIGVCEKYWGARIVRPLDCKTWIYISLQRCHFALENDDQHSTVRYFRVTEFLTGKAMYTLQWDRQWWPSLMGA